MGEHRAASAWMLVARFGATVGAIPVEHVVETMRPLPVELLAGAAEVVKGMAVVRGEALPVIDGPMAIAGRPAEMGPDARFVTLRIGADRAALLVDEVVAVRRIATAELAAMPPLAGGGTAERVRAIGMLDARLLVVLDASRILADARSHVP